MTAEDKPPNFQPTVKLPDCAIVTCYDQAGVPIDFLLLPVANTEPARRQEQIDHAYQVQELADRLISPDQLMDVKAGASVCIAVAERAARLVSTNMSRIYIKRQEVEETAITFSYDVADTDIVPTSKDEAMRVIAADAVRRMSGEVWAELIESVSGDLNAIAFVCRHVFVSVLLDVEKEHGDAAALSDVDLIRLFNEYRRRNVADYYYNRAVFFYADAIAGNYLESAAPADWPIERLRNFVGFKLSDKDGSSFSVTIRGGNLDELSKIFKERPPEVILSLGDSQSVMQGTVRFNAGEHDIKRLTVKSPLTTWGGARNVKVANLPESVRQALGGRYVELRNTLTKLKGDAKTAYEFHGNDWQQYILKKYPILERHLDLLNKINPYSALSDSEGSLKDPWQIAIEIAARETIPNYKKNSTGAVALKQAAILSPEEN
jgi:hypothetical protein